MEKIPFFFSIDFEDYYHDKKRLMGHKDPTILKDPLWKSYEKIQNFLSLEERKWLQKVTKTL